MSPPSFIHLRQHTEYSITDGLVRVDEAVSRAVQMEMPALGFTDLSNVFGWVKMYRAARAKGIKPIFGCDVWISNEADRNRPARALLLVQHREGYRTLCELLTRAYRDNLYRGRAEVDPIWFLEGTEGLLALSGGMQSGVVQALQAGNQAAARKQVEFWSKAFPGRYFLELQRYGQPDAESVIDELLEIGAELSIPSVATHPIQFLNAEDFKAHEARVCIAEGYLLADQRRPKHFTEQQYFKSPQEMAELFADLPEALENSVEIAKRCNLNLELGKSKLPQFPTPNNESLDDYIRIRAEQGLAERMVHLFPDATVRGEKYPEYQQRLDFELGTIVQMGFPGYFLIVADFINWGKHNGVPVGPGRGSGAGSLVAYSLGITDLDPLAYDLLFERFLNPERVSMPDFDIDFCQDNRERVIQYVKDKYGHDAVSQIATFGTLGSKSVIRDVGRVLDMPYTYCDKLSKLVPIEGVKPVSLARALEMEPQLKERFDEEEEVRELFGLAERLEDMTRNVGMHAGGVLIAPGKLTDFCPLYRQEGSDSYVSQFDKDDVEAIGLVKFDFLGLRTLTILDEAVRFVRRYDERKDFRLEDLTLDDPVVYKLFAEGNTTAVFQSESRSAKDLEKKLKGDCFEDIIALMALNRPGPLGSGMVDDFIVRKNDQRKTGRGKAEWYFHPDLEDTLKSTYGIIVYQEQVMLVAQILAGYTLGGADMLRRAMGKKKPEEMAKQREIFLTGAKNRGVDDALAGRLFDLMEKFAEYGFNKSHSAAYALIAYHTAWLKAYYPAEFMAATLSSEMSDTDKVRIFYEDARANGVEILPPDINRSLYRFEPQGGKRMRYGLGAIKGTGEAAINAIVAAREKDGAFASLFDLCRRVDKRQINRRVLEALVRAGAFDSLEPNRAGLLALVPAAIEAADRAANSGGQGGLFGEASEVASELPITAAPWKEKQRLMEEKLVLGFYLSGHPFAEYAPELKHFVRHRLAELQKSPEPQLLAGIIVSVRAVMGKSGKRYILLLDDGTATQELAIFQEIFEANRDLVREDELLLVEGRVSEDSYTGGLRIGVTRLLDLASARSRHARRLQLGCNGNSSSMQLKEMLAPYRIAGGCPVVIHYRNAEAVCDLSLGSDWQVSLHDHLLEKLAGWLKPENVKVAY